MIVPAKSTVIIFVIIAVPVRYRGRAVSKDTSCRYDLNNYGGAVCNVHGDKISLCAKEVKDKDTIGCTQEDHLPGCGHFCKHGTYLGCFFCNHKEATKHTDAAVKPKACASCRRLAAKYVDDCLMYMNQIVPSDYRETMIVKSLRILPDMKHIHDENGRMKYA
jgi:hypothetical protein